MSYTYTDSIAIDAPTHVVQAVLANAHAPENSPQFQEV